MSREAPVSTPANDHYTTLTRCRLCGGQEYAPILNLGDQYIANAFHPREDPPTLAAPLQLVRCRQCSLVQLAHSVKRDLMYRTYWYKSGVNNTMRTHLAGLVQNVRQLVDLRPGDVVVDIGCNDGTMLSNYPPSVTRVGVDPSNIEPQACDLRINDYFTAETVRPRLPQKARVITSIAMFYDLDDPRQFACDIRECLADDGVWVLELSYMPAMLATVSYDTICHEHVTYYRLATFEQAIAKAGLEVIQVEFNNMNGGSFRLVVAPRGARPVSGKVWEVRERESREGYDTDAPYADFVKKVAAAKVDLLKFLRGAKQEGKTVYGYGASTKGQVILQYCNITPDLIRAIAERNPEKYELYTPGTNIRICSEEEMRRAKPDALLIFPWYFLSEFLEREEQLLTEGCKIVVPLPRFEIVSFDRASQLLSKTQGPPADVLATADPLKA